MGIFNTKESSSSQRQYYEPAHERQFAPGPPLHEEQKLDENFVANVLVIGMPGTGKSTFLNFLFNGKSDSQNMKFKAMAGQESTTREVQSEQFTVWNTNCKINVFDTPGLFAQDLSPQSVFKNIEETVSSIPLTALVWIYRANDRVTILDSAIAQSLPEFINKFTYRGVIVVFTHCDQLKTGSLIEATHNFDELVNMYSLKKEFKTYNKIYFGTKEKQKEKGIYNKHTYHKDFEKIILELHNGKNTFELKKKS